MALSTSRGTQLDVDEIILTAYQQAGVMSINQGYTSPQWGARVTYGRRRLDTIIDELPTSGEFVRGIVFYDLTLTADTYIYSLPSYALDVVGDGMYIDASETDTSKASSETLVIQKSRDEWHKLSTKSATGTPSVFFVDRATSPISVRLWVIPDEAGTIRFQINQLSADTHEGDVNVDLQRYWTEYLIHRLAYVIADTSSLPRDKVSSLRKEAERLWNRARAFANDHTDNYIYVDYGKRY